MQQRDRHRTFQELMLHQLFAMIAILLITGWPSAAIAQRKPVVPVPEFPFLPPEQVSIFPVFFVASDQPVPPPSEAAALQRHLKWARDWFGEQLGGTSTFRIFSDQAYLYHGRHPLAHYVSQGPGERAPLHATELLDHFKLTRFNCPFVFVVIVDYLKERPNGGRPLNGGFNSGGGIVQMSRTTLTGSPAFQGVLRHELGHSFGLQHVSLYGYDMKTNRSAMSYSYNHATGPRGFQESPTPQILIPEDIRALSLNDRVFPNLTFEPERHIPRGYSISPKIRGFSPMTLPEHPQDRIEMISLSGEALDSKAENLVRKKIIPNERAENNRLGINYDKRSMWHSDDTGREYRSLEVTFPVETALTSIRIHSQHSGRVHPVVAFRAAVLDGGDETVVAESGIDSDNQLVVFQPVTSRRWRLDFKPGKSGKVVLRGLQFYYNDTELYQALTSDDDAAPVEKQP